MESVIEGSDSPAFPWNKVILLSHGLCGTTRFVRTMCKKEDYYPVYRITFLVLSLRRCCIIPIHKAATFVLTEYEK